MSIAKTLGGRVKALVISLAAFALLFGLSACGSPKARDLSADGAVSAISCEEIVGVSNEISALAESKTKKRLTLRDWGLDPENAEQIKTVREALSQRVTECQKSSSPSATASPTTSPTAAPTSTCATWKRVDMPANERNRWLVDGLPALREAKNEQEARAAILAWVEKVRQDPITFAGTVKYFLQRDVAQPTLFENGCATQASVALETELLVAVGQAAVKPEEAPSDGTNSGVDGGKVVVGTSGVSGDRAAVRVTLPDGRVIWVLARCGNPVTRGSHVPNLPKGRTDEPPPAPAKPVKPAPPAQPAPPPPLAPKKAEKLKDLPAGKPKASKPDPKKAEKTAPSGPSVTNGSGKTTPVKPANPAAQPAAPAPGAKAPGAKPVPPAPKPAPKPTQAPAPDDPGKESSDPGAPPP